MPQTKTNGGPMIKLEAAQPVNIPTLSAEQRRMAETEAYHHQLYAAVATGLGATCLMYAMSFPTFGIPSMLKDPNFEISQFQGSLMSSIGAVVSLVGNLGAGTLVNRIGRKNTLIAGGLIHLVASVCLASSGSIFWALVFRAMFGISSSLMMIGGMMYMAEVVHPNHRDRMGCVGGVLANAGMLVAFTCGSLFEWRALVMAGALMAVPFLYMVSTLTETPVYLLRQEKASEALSALSYYRSSFIIARAEIKKLIESNHREKTADVSIVELFSAPYNKPVFVVLLMLVAQQTSGMFAITMNAVTIFEDFGTTVNPAFCTIMIAVINIIITIVGAEIHSRCDRTRTLLVSSLVLGGSLFMLATFYRVLTAGGSYTALAKNHTYVPLFLILLYFAAFGIGLGPIPMMYISEGLPSKIRGPATGIVMTINTIVLIAILIMFKTLVTEVGYSFLFMFLGIVTTSLVGLILMHMQETKGLSISDIDKQYESLLKKLHQE